MTIDTPFQQITELMPAYDHRAEGGGIHGVELRMILKGPAGATQFLLYTQRHLPHVQQGLVHELAELRPQFFATTQAENLEAFRAWSGPFPEGADVCAALVEYERALDHLFGPRGAYGGRGVLTCVVEPLPADLGYHSPRPMYDGHQPMRHMYQAPRFGAPTAPGEEPSFTEGVYGDPVICPYLPNDGPCYYDGSSLNAERVYARLLREGAAGVWAALEAYYRSTFEEQDDG